MFGHLLSVSGKGRSLTGGKVIHPDPIAFDADFLEEIMDVVDPFPALEIALIIMTVALEAADAINPVGAFLKTPEHIGYINFAGTWNPEYFNISGVRQSHRTCQVRSRVPSIVATERYNIRFEISHYIPSASRVSISQVIWLSS